MSRDNAYFVTMFRSSSAVLCKPVFRRYAKPTESRGCARYLECFSTPCRQRHIGHACGGQNGTIQEVR